MNAAYSPPKGMYVRQGTKLVGELPRTPSRRSSEKTLPRTRVNNKDRSMCLTPPGGIMRGVDLVEKRWRARRNLRVGRGEQGTGSAFFWKRLSKETSRPWTR